MTMLLLWLQPSSSPKFSLLFNLNAPYIFSRTCLSTFSEFSVFVRRFYPIVFLDLFRHVVFSNPLRHVAFFVIII